MHFQAIMTAVLVCAGSHDLHPTLEYEPSSSGVKLAKEGFFNLNCHLNNL